MNSDNITRLIVVRHGNTFNKGDVILRVGSATDIPLTETGLEQGRFVGKYLKMQNLTPDIIFHAPLLRTKESARMLRETSESDAALQEAAFLTELNYGSDDGAPENEVVLHLGAIELAHITAKTTLADMYEAGKTVLNCWDKRAILPKAWYFLEERVKQLACDWQKFAAKIAAEYTGKNIVAVTSNGIARFSQSILPAGASMPESLKLATGAIGIYEYKDGNWSCREWNIRPDKLLQNK